MQEIKITNEPENWEAVFSSLLPNTDLNNFQKNYQGDSITFKGTRQDIETLKDTLNTHLESPQTILTKLPYVNKQIHNPKHKGINILEKLFGETYELLSGFDVTWKKFFEEKTSVSISKKSLINSAIWEECKKSLIDTLSNWTTSEIRKRISNIDDSTYEYKIDPLLIDKCFSFTETGHVQFDYLRLLSYVYPPTIEYTTENNETASLKISKKELAAYLRAIFPEGFIVERQNTITLLPTPQTQPPLNIHLFLDVSKSMDEYKASYQKQVIEFINELSTHLNGKEATLQITLFSDEATTYTYDLHSNKDLIHELLLNLQCQGRTNIYGTLLGALENIDLKENNTYIFFTDGVDNESYDEVKEATLREIGISKPKIFTLGFGNNFDDLLNELSKRTGVEHATIENINDFTSTLVEYLDKMSKLRVLVKIDDLFTSVYDDPTRVTGVNTSSFKLDGQDYSFEKNVSENKEPNRNSFNFSNLPQDDETSQNKNKLVI